MAAATQAAQAEHQAGRRGGMPVWHAMLVITRAVFDMVEIPGQEPLVVAKDTGDEAARRGWLFNGAEHSPVDLGLPVSQFGYPIREVLGCLDRLSLDGWQIVQVSEDRSGSLDGRGAYPDGEMAAEPGISTARYLLSRPD
jgi:hypothetical protein